MLALKRRCRPKGIPPLSGKRPEARGGQRMEVRRSVAARRLDEPLVLLAAGQHGLRGLKAHHVAARKALGASVVYEVLEVGERLGEGEA